MQKLLIVDDDAVRLADLARCFDSYDVIESSNRSEAVAALRRHEPDVVLLDLGLPPDPDGVSEGLACVEEILNLAPDTKVVVITGERAQHHAIEAVGMGAYDFYRMPIHPETLRLIVSRAFHMRDLEVENRKLHKASGHSMLEGIVTASENMNQVCRTIEKVAPTDVTALLLGESGTGKELLARALYSQSQRSEERFVAINCAAIPENLLESELFGYEKGAFTGAAKTTPGKIEMAHKGTLFLDEIGDMPLPLQAKLLRFLQERVVERVGGRREIAVDVRVVCATNQNLQDLIAAGQFREDLYYRVSEITIRIPPLRERESGRLILARTLIEKYCKSLGRPLTSLSKAAQDAVLAYHWPGNVREMENKIKGAVIMADGKQLSPEDLDLADIDAEPPSLNLREVRQAAETKAIRSALVSTYGNISRTAALLGITRPTLYDLMDKYGMSAEGYTRKSKQRSG